jgi:FtsP/CotA-like multicopper oxidase with cupredoxin domain
MNCEWIPPLALTCIRSSERLVRSSTARTRSTWVSAWFTNSGSVCENASCHASPRKAFLIVLTVRKWHARSGSCRSRSSDWMIASPIFATRRPLDVRCTSSETLRIRLPQAAAFFLRDQDLEHGSAIREQISRRVEIPSSHCGAASEQTPERVFTLNGDIRPRIPIDPGERQFWRIVNASPDRYADLQISSGRFEIVGLDGMPLSYHDHLRPTWKTLSTRCVDTGRAVAITAGQAIYKDLPAQEIQKLQSTDPAFTVIFTEDKSGFYINGKKFSMHDDPMLRVRVGSIQHWRIVNSTKELHPFHIHQIHFLAYAQNGIQADPPQWLDTVNVPLRGTVDLIMDFTDPVIRGMSVFHCHLLSHEDKGMMAKILFE